MEDRPAAHAGGALSATGDAERRNPAFPRGAWERAAFGVEKPTEKLAGPPALDSEAFVAEVKKVRGRGKYLTVAEGKVLREEHAKAAVPARELAAEAAGPERKVSTWSMPPTALRPTRSP